MATMEEVHSSAMTRVSRWRRRECEPGGGEPQTMDKALKYSADCFPASPWACSGVPIVVLLNGHPKF